MPKVTYECARGHVSKVWLHPEDLRRPRPVSCPSCGLGMDGPHLAQAEPEQPEGEWEGSKYQREDPPGFDSYQRRH